jgi:hypothetical protein
VVINWLLIDSMETLKVVGLSVALVLESPVNIGRRRYLYGCLYRCTELVFPLKMNKVNYLPYRNWLSTMEVKAVIGYFLTCMGPARSECL